MDKRAGLTTPLVVFMVVMGIIAASITFYVLFKYSSTDWNSVKDRSIGHDTYTDLAIKNMLQKPIVVSFDDKTVQMPIAELVALSADRRDDSSFKTMTQDVLLKYGDMYLSFADPVVTNEVKKRTREWGIELIYDSSSYISMGYQPSDVWTVVLGSIAEVSNLFFGDVQYVPGMAYDIVKGIRGIKRVVNIPTATGKNMQLVYYWRLETK